ncbi:uncharacterized protein MELLADRAFT_111710 [Melampsora larici-populina 98AG31]|uniref:Uncharacterized protein n=1 Tax=Melampsora larici-populina (strain 98AG31 / pathotype 3-4-7) TaxID=747676 RepID=F4S4A3_MELLP|nr:uncharacterized protein MELLADRAFT_111710 [Melampsora larici-populina 98AG31]EGG00590.1 hypothetical protein MELLADRAFT_111710 [Melampsora larici-populina 98AG31]
MSGLEFGEDAWGTIDKLYPSDWRKTPGLPELSAREQLQSYLERTTEERKNSGPFFCGLHPSENELPGADALKKMNTMLQSEPEAWPSHIHDVFKTQLSHHMVNFWIFMTEIANFMPTPVLQKTLVEVIIEKDRLWSPPAEEESPRIAAILYDLQISYEDKMREHVQLLNNKDIYDTAPRKPQEVVDVFAEVVDVFSRHEQERMGEYGIRLAKEWSSGEQVELYKHWASRE